MRRRKDGLFITLCELPWWVSVIAAGIVYVATNYLFPHFAAGHMYLAAAATGLRPYSGFLLAFFLVTAVLSVVRSTSRRQLLDIQSDLDSIRNMTWRDFEKLCGEAFRRRGYHIHENGLGGADGGIDLVLKKDSTTSLVQCKRWKTFKVGVREIRELYGIVAAEGADRGIFVTSGAYTAEARAFAKGKPLDLFDGHALLELVKTVQKRPAEPPRSRHGQASLMAATAASSIPFPSGRTPSSTAANVPTCPRCGAPMVLRLAKRGANSGSTFWGCSSYPNCRGTRGIGDSATGPQK